jgi:hypothetical protein
MKDFSRFFVNKIQYWNATFSPTNYSKGNEGLQKKRITKILLLMNRVRNFDFSFLSRLNSGHKTVPSSWQHLYTLETYLPRLQDIMPMSTP